ncbi:unnamed protein product [Closterium sp. NIES-65]|nr:unnamed protein product [Closterium sp. NIES-65]
MATPSVLAFDAEGRAIDFDVWVDDLQLFLQCDRVDGLSLFDLTSGASPAPSANADATVRSQWATRDAAARLAVRHHLPTSERAHFSQYKSAQTLYDTVVARYSSPATAALSRLMLPYLFPGLAAFPTVADLIMHLRTSDTRYRAALLAEDNFLSVCPTTLTVDLLEKGLLAVEKSIVAVGASRGDPRIPIFEGCSPSPLLPSVASAAAADLVGLESVAVFDLDFDALLAAMYAVTISDEGDCYRCFPPDPGIETAALGTGEAAALGASKAAALGARASAPSDAGESALSGTASASASHTFTLDLGASRSFF